MMLCVWERRTIGDKRAGPKKKSRTETHKMEFSRHDKVFYQTEYECIRAFGTLSTEIIEDCVIDMEIGDPSSMTLSRVDFVCFSDINRMFGAIFDNRVAVVKIEITKIKPVYLHWLTGASNINGLRFAHCNCESYAMRSFERELDGYDYDKVGNIDVISINKFDTDEADVDALIRIMMRCKPIHLTCSETRFNIHDAFSIPTSWFQNLTEIVFDNAEIGNHGLALLVSVLADNDIIWNIRILALRHDYITDMSVLFRIIATGKLETLDLSDNVYLTIPDSYLLADSIEASDSLEVLRIDGARGVTDDTIMPLFRFPVLMHPLFREFTCSRTGVSTKLDDRFNEFVAPNLRNPLHCAIGLIAATRFESGRFSTMFPIVLCRIICQWLWQE